jgi:hypothetical protein
MTYIFFRTKPILSVFYTKKDKTENSIEKFCYIFYRIIFNYFFEKMFSKLILCGIMIFVSALKISILIKFPSGEHDKSKIINLK